jgi:hypothetical protein
LKSLQLGPWPGFTEKPIGDDQIPARGLTGGDGEVGEKVQELTVITGVAGVEEERCDSSCTCNLGTLFVSVKYVLDSVKLVCVYVKFLQI